MDNIYVIGAGGLGKEVLWILNRINERNPTWNIVGFVDDGIAPGTDILGHKVLGGIRYLNQLKEKVNAVCAIGSPKIRRKVIEMLDGNICFPTIADPSAIISPDAKIGKGSIISIQTIVSVNAVIGEFVLINVKSNIGHDSTIGDYVTIFNHVEIAGGVMIEDMVEVGSNAVVIPGKFIANGTIIGANAAVVKDIKQKGTYVGVPAKWIGKKL